jgi:hypothetical protein
VYHFRIPAAGLGAGAAMPLDEDRTCAFTRRQLACDCKTYGASADDLSALSMDLVNLEYGPVPTACVKSACFAAPIEKFRRRTLVAALEKSFEGIIIRACGRAQPEDYIIMGVACVRQGSC